MSKNYQFNFNIPWFIVVLAFMFNPPIGVILAILRTVSFSKAQEKINRRINEGYGHLHEGMERWREEMDFRSEREAKKETRRESRRQKRKDKKSAMTRLTTGIFVFSTIIAALGLFSVIVDGGSLSMMVSDFFENFLPFGIVSGLSYMASSFFKGRDARHNRIRAIIGDRDSVSLVKLATASKTPLKKVCKDVQYLIDKGEFGDTAYIDLSTNNFMRYSEAEPDYVEGFDYRTVYDGDIFGKSAKDSEPASKDREKSSESAASTTIDTESTDKDNFRAIILEIRRLNDEIHDFKVSERIYRIEEHTQHIFDYVTEHPEAMPQIRTFMNYYLPTTLKLLESYSRIERVGVAGENMKKSKENIENILDMLVVGFEQQVDQLFKNESIDISSDISVLETMMQKDGLSGKSDFQINLESLAANKKSDSDIFDIDLGGMAAQRMPSPTDMGNVVSTDSANRKEAAEE